jgi:hypothetical protein
MKYKPKVRKMKVYELRDGRKVEAYCLTLNKTARERTEQYKSDNQGTEKLHGGIN